MKVLYFGTVCDIEAYGKAIEDSAFTPSVAPIVFETALLEGLKKNGVEAEIHSFPMVPTFPSSKLLKFGGVVERLSMGYECRWLETVNFPVFKQLSRKLDGKRVLKKWLKKNAPEGVVVTYSIPPFLVKDVLRYSKKYGVKTIAIVPDLLRDMYINEDQSSFSAKLKQRYLRPAIRLQDGYSGYVYLTEAMHEVVAPHKPFIVMEGIADPRAYECGAFERPCSKAIMYAGMLHEKYGLMNLVDAFEALEASGVELWLFGEGTAAEEIRKRSESNSAIKYFGSVSRAEVLRFERAATLLVNVRDPNDEFTRFSFPSKTIEYMFSGTPLMTTRLKGIPDEYFDHAFVAKDGSVESLKETLSHALALSDAELERRGKSAREFVQARVDAERQAARIVTFINGIPE